MSQKDAMVGNAADEGQVANATRLTKQQRSQREADLKALLARPEGVRFLGALLADLRPEGAVVKQDVQQLYFNLGLIEAGRRLKAEIHAASPDAFLAIVQEYPHV